MPVRIMLQLLALADACTNQTIDFTSRKKDNKKGQNKTKHVGICAPFC